MTGHYPNLTRDSLRVILTAAPGAEITPAIVASVTGDVSNFAPVIADLGRVHMVDENNELTPLADRYAAICRQWLR